METCLKYCIFFLQRIAQWNLVFTSQRLLIRIATQKSFYSEVGVVYTNFHYG